MKKYILAIFLFTIFGCSDFLDETPSEGGLVKFQNVGQFEAILNDLFITRNRIEWSSAILASDDCNFDPKWQVDGAAASLSTIQQFEGRSIWNEEILKSLGGGGSGFVPFISTYSNMYNLNYIITKVDDENIQGTKEKKEEVKAEAKFWRGFYHFLTAVEYCSHPALNGGNSLGIGYRNSVSSVNTGVESRQTVKFTLDNVIKDLEESKASLKQVGKTTFNINQPWRITSPAVEALLARVYLYMGDYPKAFANAKAAFDAHKFLYDLNNQTLFALSALTPAQTETFNGVAYSVTRQLPAIARDASTVDPASNSPFWYKESYFRACSQLAALSRMPPTKELYEMYDAQDLRKKVYYDLNSNILATSWLPARYKDQLLSISYMKNNTTQVQSGYILGVTVPEIMLIMAECRARNVGEGASASELLKQLRSKRFPANYVDNIGGTLEDVKNERRRELAMVMRWYDLKRYNALDNANITITKIGRVNPYDINSDIVTFQLAPNSPAYAIQLPQSEVELLGWQQNEFNGVTKK
jgi:starch-binding outer membrane protein, SusD/RagB family